MASRGTPARGMRARNASQTPLPALPSRQSTAYGAVGKATLSTQLATSAAGFEQAFDNAVAPRESEPPEATPARRSRRNPKPPSPSPIEEDDPPEEVEEDPTQESEVTDKDRDDRSSTGVPEDAVYGAASSEKAANSDQPPTKTLHDAAIFVPRLLQNTGLTYSVKDILLVTVVLFQLLTAVLIGCLGTVTFTALVPLPQDSSISRYRDTVIAPFVPAAMQKVHNMLFVKSISKAQDDIHGLQSQISQFKLELEKLGDMLPPALVVRRTDGQIVIEDDMWDAIVARLSDDKGAVWELFIKTNEDRVAGLLSERFSTLAQEHHLLTRSQLIEELQSHTQATSGRVSAALSDFQNKTLSQARDEARRAASHTLQALTKDNKILSDASTLIRSLQATNLVFNLDRLMTTRNLFSPGLGARIDPHLTSPTQQSNKSTSFLYRLYHTFLPTSSPLPHPASTALIPWSEATDCWCAAYTPDKLNAQLAVRLPRRVIPQRLFLEHIPAAGAKDIGAAPRAFEVWVEVGREETKRLEGVEEGWESWEKGNREEFCSWPPGESEGWLKAKNAGRRKRTDWWCLGGGEYDIHARNYLQEWSPFFDPARWNVTADRVVVRVKSNWGAGHTCLYRVWLSDDS